MAVVEVLFEKSISKIIANKFKNYLFHNKDNNQNILIANEETSMQGGAIVHYFEISDLNSGEEFLLALEYAYDNIAAKYKNNIITKVYHDSEGEEEFFIKSARKLMRFDSLEDVELYRNAINSNTKTHVAQYFESNICDKYAILRVKIERKKHENQIEKVFEAILKTDDLQVKDRVFAAALDNIIDAGEAHHKELFEEGKKWREDMKYEKGRVGSINFLESLVEYHVEKRFLTMLLLDTPHDRKHYVPFIWGFWGILGLKTEMKIWSKDPSRTRILWHYEDNVMGPTKSGAYAVDDWSYDNKRSINCEYY